MIVGTGSQGGRHYGKRLLAAAAVLSLLFSVLLGRLYVLQVARGEEFAEKSQENFIKEVRLPASRGVIYDRHRIALVDERPNNDVLLTPYFCHNCDETISRLQDLLSLDSEAITRVKDQVKHAHGLMRYRSFPVKVDVSRDDVDRVKSALIDLPGVDVLPTPHRNYRFGLLAAPVLGYMNEITPEELASADPNGPHYEQGDYIGRRGIERRLESDLKGLDGVERVVVDARGNRIPDKDDLIKDDQRRKPPVPGHNLILTLDVKLQDAAERIFPGKAGSVIVLDVNTGDVLALVSRPSYDPNKMSGRITREALKEMSEDPLQPMVFRPTQQQYNPGSTFKVVTALAALETGALHDDSTIYCGGGYQLGRRRWRCDKESGHGSLDLTEAIARSCDVFFYTLGDRMGIEPIARMSEALGLGAPVGLDLGYETPGVVPSVEWHNEHTPGGYQKGFALNTAIGQGDNNVTPMQEAVLYAAIANGGTVYRPHLLKRVEDSDGRILREVEPQVVRKLPVTPEHLAAVVAGLRAVVNTPGGTAYGARLKNFPIEVAGKTGTAQVGAIGEHRVKEGDLDYWHKSNSWFASFAPADHPEIAVVVLNEHGGFGASAAAPTAMAVIKAYFDLKAQAEADSQGVPFTMPSPSAPPPPPTPPAHRPTHEVSNNAGTALAKVADPQDDASGFDFTRTGRGASRPEPEPGVSAPAPSPQGALPSP